MINLFLGGNMRLLLLSQSLNILGLECDLPETSC